MEQKIYFKTFVYTESPVSAFSLMKEIRRILDIPSHIPEEEYATELFFSEDESFPVRVNMEFGEDFGHKPLIEPDDEYELEHIPYIETTLISDADLQTQLGGNVQDVHAAVLSELNQWFSQHGIDWSFSSSLDSSGKWIPGSHFYLLGNADLADPSSLSVT